MPCTDSNSTGFSVFVISVLHEQCYKVENNQVLKPDRPVTQAK